MTALREGAPYLPADLPLPPVIGTNAGFWKAASEGRLDVQQCRECGAHRHPPTEGCYRCGSLDWGWVESVVPYNVSVVEVDGTSDEPVRLVSNVVDATDETLHVGSRVTLACDKLTDEVGLPRFRLA